MTGITRPSLPRKARASFKSPRLGLVVLFIILIVLVVGLTILSISYNWRYAVINQEANVFNLIKERLSNLNLPIR